MRSAEEAAAFAREYAADDTHGYDMNREYPDTDCSQFIAMCYDLPLDMWTGNELGILEENGFAIHDFDGCYSDNGDGAVFWLQGHTAIDSGGGISEASGDANGTFTDCPDGDQGNEIFTHGYGEYQSNWEKVCIPPDGGGSATESSVDRSDGFIGSGMVYEVHTCDGWLGEVSKADDTDDGYAGWKEKGIDGIRGIGVTLKAEMTDGEVLDPTVFESSMFGDNTSGDGYCGDIDSGRYISKLWVQGCNGRGAVEGQGWFPPLVDGNTSDGDDYIGEEGKALVAIQMWR